jgi:diguanylate cyclase (GGDEF)-like protein
MLSFIAGVFFVFNKEEHDEIRYFSEYDTMTGVYNRRAGFDKLNHIYAKHEDDDVKISICFIDVNGLKEVNDNFGHDDGDDLLQTIVEMIKRNIRDRDFVARFGGDEFVIIFEDLDTEGAERVWTRIRGDLEYINQTENRKYLVSASHGIETLTYGEAIDDTINRADEKMYEEKRKIKENIKIIR